VIGIRREDKNRWERRVPLTPDHVAELVSERRIEVRVQPSSLRVFPDKDYAAAGAVVDEDLSACPLVIGVKEIPADKLLRGQACLYFSHVIKGQPGSMPMLRRMMELGGTLLDYEPIVDRRGRRLIFFGRHAGYAGMLDSLWALGQRLRHEGFETPLADLRLAHQYAGLDEALDHVSRVGERIRHVGLPSGLRPIVVGFTGSGNVSQGAQEVFGRLPFLGIDPEELPGLHEDRERPRSLLFKTVFERHHRVRRIPGGGFDAPEYENHPDRYESALGPLLRHLTVFINGVYWEPGQPRLITIEHLKRLFDSEQQPKLRVIGDITCDVGGSIEANRRATDSGDPVYVYETESGATPSGIDGRGPVIMAVDNLPCELPREASQHFGDSLMRFVPALARCDWKAPFETLGLPPELKRAVIVHRGALTPRYAGLEAALRAA